MDIYIPHVMMIAWISLDNAHDHEQQIWVPKLVLIPGTTRMINPGLGSCRMLRGRCPDCQARLLHRLLHLQHHHTNQVSGSSAARTMFVPLRLQRLVQLFCYMGLPQMGPDGLRRGSLPSAKTRWQGVGAWTGRRPSWETDAMPWADNPDQSGLG